MEEESKNKTWRIGNDGRIHRRRRKVFPNGDIYECEFVDNKPDGSGTLITAKGMKYEGNFANGLFHGAGKITWYTDEIDGKTKPVQRFDGIFKNGKKCGWGILHENGNRFEGNFDNDVLNGKGSVWLASGERRKGTFQNGKLHCDDGLICFENGDTYEGPVHLGNMHGDVGHYTYAAKKGFYTGQHHIGIREGVGTRRFSDDSTFRGDMKEGRISGHGSMNYENDLDTRKKYIGDWKDGSYHGYGELIFKDSSDLEYYKGHFIAGTFDGSGRLQYRDGGYYEGHFKAIAEDKCLFEKYSMFGQRDGKGKRVWSSGNQFEGEWRNDAMLQGRYFDVTHHSTYVGSFEGNKKSGTGRETWVSPNGKSFKDPCLGWKHASDGVCKYAGGYQKGFFSGKGTFQAPDGRTYEGEWKAGKPHGFGSMTLLRNHERGDSLRMYIGKYGSLYRPTIYAGMWKNGLKHGAGTLTYADGSVKKVTCAEGAIIKI